MKNKYLITGFSGFVSRHFLNYLNDNNLECCILGIDKSKPEFSYNNYKDLDITFKELNMLDKESLQNLLSEFKPHYILHLASYSNVAFSWKNPVLSFQNNTNIFINLIESVRSEKINCRILSVGSSDEYGTFSENELPLTENMKLMPTSPYAVAKLSQEFLSKIYFQGYGLDIVMTRSFSHFGPGQNETFAIASFVKQFVQIKRKILKNKVLVGNISIIRDYIDVRDVVSAYYLLLQNGISGEVYNICSGKGISLVDIINILKSKTETNPEIVIDNNLIRPSDISVVVGNNSKIKKHTNWEIKYDIQQTIEDTINYWESIL